MLINTVLFIAIIMAILAGVANPVLSHYSFATGILASKQSYMVSQSAVEDAVYRLKNGIDLPSSFALNLSSGSANTTITTTQTGKSISVAAGRSGYQRNVQADLTAGTGVSFHYGIQSGNGGFNLTGGAVVDGNVYSNGNIKATTGVTITGSAFAADSEAITADQTNDSPMPPSSTISFSPVSTSVEDFAQSFQVSTTAPLSNISFYMEKVGSPSDITVHIVTDSGGSPSGNDVTTSGTLSASLVGTSGLGWVNYTFPQNTSLTPGTTYWLVLSNGTSKKLSSNYYLMGANSAYPGGTAKVGKYKGTWSNTSPSGLDGYFELYLGGTTSMIGGNTYTTGVYVGQNGSGDAWAHYVQGATVAGHLYCQNSSYTNKACDTSQPDPLPQPYPVSDANIQDWENQAVDGGATSTVNIGWAGGTLGPVKINGNLSVNGGGTLDVTGTIWVTGTLTVSGGGKIKLDPTYGGNSGVIVANGIVNLGGGGNLSGSGQSGSYLMILTTSDCPNDPSCGGQDALTLSGGAGAVVLNAQNGTMNLEGGSGVHEATANEIDASGGAVITYDSGLANTNFTSGPGGGYNIVDWVEY